MMDAHLHLGFASLLPAIIALGVAIVSKRVIISLVFGILTGVFLVDMHFHGVGYAVLKALPHLFDAIVGHDPDPAKGWLRGMGLVNGTGRAEVVVFVLLLGAFVAVLEKSGSAFSFGKAIAKKLSTRRGVQTSASFMGCALFTSAYFSSLATGTVFRSVFDRLKISREKLAFLIDSTSAPINTLIPISGWVAYMSILLADNIPGVEDGVLALIKTVPYNFYCLLLLVFVFLLSYGTFGDFGAMLKAEKRAQSRSSNDEDDDKMPEGFDKLGTVMDMAIPLGVSVVMLVVLGLWNYTLANYGFQKIPLGGNQILILSFAVGIVVAFAKYVGSGLMSSKEFLDIAADGSKSAVMGGMIIILAVTLGDVLRASLPEGVGAAMYLEEVARGIPLAVLPLAVFILSSFMGFAMGTSWGVWAIMIPVSIPLCLSIGGNPYVVAAAVLSGGTFGDHCSPISDTTVMSSIGAGCDHIEHVKTQLPYALFVAGVSSVLYLVLGFM